MAAGEAFTGNFGRVGGLSYRCGRPALSHPAGAVPVFEGRFRRGIGESLSGPSLGIRPNLERAFQFARSGKYTSIEELKK